MTLNASGPISLGGSTTGQSINLELTQSATATVSLNDTNVRTLAGVSSGQISMPSNFWGKSYVPPFQTTLTNVLSPSFYISYLVRGANACDRTPANTVKPTTASFFCCGYGDEFSGQVAIYRSQNLGNNWSLVKLATDAAQGNISSVSAKAISTSQSIVCAPVVKNYLTGGGAFVTRSTNSGSSWSNVTIPDPTGGNQAVGSICANQYPGSTEWMMVFVVQPTNTAYVLRSTDSGASWSSVSSFPCTWNGYVGQFSLSCSNDASTASTWMFNDLNNLFRSTNSGTSWTNVFSVSSSASWVNHPVYGAGTWVVSYRPTVSTWSSGSTAYQGYAYSTDNGGSWTTVLFPNATGYPASGSGVVWTSSLVNYVEDYHSGLGNFVFMAFGYGASATTDRVFVSTNGGVSITNTPSVGGYGLPTASPSDTYAPGVWSYGPVIGVFESSDTGPFYTIVPS